MALQSLAYITLDLQATEPVFVSAMQNDLRSRTITAQLRDGGVAWAPGSGVSAAIRYRKPDGTAGFYDRLENNTVAWSISGSVLTFTLAEQVLTVPGVVAAEVNFYSSAGVRLTVLPFWLRVQASVLDDATIVSSDYYNVLTAQIASALSAAERAEAAAAGIVWKIYDSLSSFGLGDSGNTIAGAWAALPIRSTLIVPAAFFGSTQLPSTLGTVEIVKHGVRRGWVFFHQVGGGLFSMGLDTGNDTVSGVWSGAKQYVYRDITSAAFDLNAGANNYGRTVAIPTVSGYTPIGIISARLQGTGYAACAFNGYYLSDSNVGFGVMNNGSVNRTGLTAIFRVLYEISEITVS